LDCSGRSSSAPTSGRGPPVEDPIPVNLDLELGLPFDFYGLGQTINGPNVDPNPEQNQDGWDN
jgi:hypothetical protein